MHHSRIRYLQPYLFGFFSRVATSWFPWGAKRTRRTEHTGWLTAEREEGRRKKVRRKSETRGSRDEDGEGFEKNRDSGMMHSCVFLQLRMERDEKDGLYFLTLLLQIKEWKWNVGGWIRLRVGDVSAFLRHARTAQEFICDCLLWLSRVARPIHISLYSF